MNQLRITTHALPFRLLHCYKWLNCFLKTVKVRFLYLYFVALGLGMAPVDLSAQTICDDPIAGKDAVVDQIGTGLLCLLCGNADLERLTDGDLNNYASFNAPVSLLSTTPVVSIKDIANTFPSGTRTGFVIEAQGGLISASILSAFQLRTYSNDVLQQTVTGSSLTQTAMGGDGKKTRLSFVTSAPFDEVELLLVSTLGVLSSVRVYYAYVEPASGCNYACVESVTDLNYNASINNALTGISGLCIGCAVSNTANVQNTDTITDFGTIFMLATVGASGSISVKANETIPAGYDAGFAVKDGGGLLGLINLAVINNTQIITYLNGVGQDTINAGNSLANVSLLGGSNNVNLISFKTTSDFDEIRLRVSSLLGLAIDLDVLFAFVRPDTDADGMVNCVDKCAGFPDYLDTDGDGIPNGCDAAICVVNAGIDQAICPPSEVAQLPMAGGGQSWSALASNPVAASVNNLGVVGGMTQEGVYGFVLTEGACTDTVYLRRFKSTLSEECNNPIVANNVIIDQIGLTGGICLLCGGGNGGQEVIDGNLNNYSEYTIGVGVLTATSIISVKDTAQVYPAGRRTGFVVETVGGILDLTALSSLEIRTYLNNSIRETATVSNGLLGAGALTGNGNRQRLAFTTTQTFDEVELVATSVLGALSSLRVYYAFEEPLTCAEDTGVACAEQLTADNDTYCGQINYLRTGISGICTACVVDNISNVIDADAASYSSINLTIGVGAAADLSVRMRQVVPAGYVTGFTLQTPANLLDLTVLGAIRLRTYSNGVLQEDIPASDGLVNVSVLNSTSGLSRLAYKTTSAFDEVQLHIAGLVSALNTVFVYAPFVYGDSDNDGAPDCADKCCGSDDNLDNNGNGIPNACDPIPVAGNDVIGIQEDQVFQIAVLTNDTFGAQGPGQGTIVIVDAGNLGVASVNDNGTPTVQSDDMITYTPTLNISGLDTLAYRIYDVDQDGDTAFVYLEITAINDLPIALNDTVTTQEELAVVFNPLTNDSDVDGMLDTATLDLNPGQSGIQDTLIVPGQGVFTANPATGAVTFVPAPNFSGFSTLNYTVCDNGSPLPVQCSGATATIVVAPDTVARLKIRVMLQGALTGTLNNLMRDDLRIGNYIPLNEPYTALSAAYPRFIHYDGGGETTNGAVLAANAGTGDAIVDWVFVELRSAGSNTTVIQTRSALVQRDGDVVDATDGTSMLQFPGRVGEQYYVAIKHRNHLGTMLLNAMLFNNDSTVVDFINTTTTLLYDKPGANNFEGMELYEYTPGKRALWAGNALGNNKLKYQGTAADNPGILTPVLADPGNTAGFYNYNNALGYFTGDVNLDGKVKYQGANNDVSFIFSNVVGLYPLNILALYNFDLFLEQLPD